MKQPTLVIMAAGIGSRYGAGIKQLMPVNAGGHIIMDYSIHDAIRAGFGKIVFIIRRDIEQDFQECIGNRIGAVCAPHGISVSYAFQELGDIPGELPEGRAKPWGTGQAILAARDQLDGPFVVINADDYYGPSAFRTLHDWLTEPHAPTDCALAGFILRNTLSENGGVTRGLCQVNAEGYLTGIQETPGIVKTPAGAAAGGVDIDPDSHVSMNMWALQPEFLADLEQGFRDFFRDSVPANPLKAEYLLPVFIGQLLQAGKIRVQVLESRDTWFGVTYQEDKPTVIASFRDLIDRGVYAEDLYSDL